MPGGGMMLGAPQGSHCPQCGGGAIPRGPSSPGSSQVSECCFPTTTPARAPVAAWGAKSGSGSGVSPCRAGEAVGDSEREPRAMQHTGTVLPVTPVSCRRHQLQSARASCLVKMNRKYRFSKATRSVACKHEFHFLQNPQGV